MEKIYFAGTDGDTYDNYDISKAVRIFNGKHIDAENFMEIRKFAKKCRGIKCELKNPPIEYFIGKGNIVKAIRLYYDTHPGVTLAEAKDFVYEMRDIMNQRITL